MKRLLQVAANDFRLVFRDRSLKVFLILPLLNLLVIRYGLPYAAGIFDVLSGYISVILMLITMQGSLGFGFIYSMVLLDEKDTGVNKVYGVLPVSQYWFVQMRLAAPFLLSAVSTFLLLLVEPFYDLSIAASAFYSILAGLVAPVMVLFVAILSNNKIEAMTWQKLFNLPVSLPILAFLIPPVFSPLFVVFPTYWAFRGLEQVIRADDPLIFFLTGLLYSLLVIALLARKFSKTHFS